MSASVNVILNTKVEIMSIRNMAGYLDAWVIQIMTLCM